MLWFTLFHEASQMIKPMCGKEGKICGYDGEWFIAQIYVLKFKFMMFMCLLKRPISPQASMGFKNWEIDAIVGRLCQNFCKNLRKKLQQLKQD